MAVPNFNSTTQPVYGQDVLSSGAGTVAPQQMAKPAIQKPAQELARRILPTFNNGNPMGANNMESRIAQMRQRSRQMGEARQQRQPQGWTQDQWGNYTYNDNSTPQFDRNDLVVGRRGGEYSTMPVFNTMGNDGTYRPGNANYYGGQSAGAGRYRPPTMDERGRWQDSGGYNYNLPNAFGSYPGYGQGNPWSQRLGPGYGGLFDFMPQFLPYGGG